MKNILARASLRIKSTGDVDADTVTGTEQDAIQSAANKRPSLDREPSGKSGVASHAILSARRVSSETIRSHLDSSSSSRGTSNNGAPKKNPSDDSATTDADIVSIPETTAPPSGPSKSGRVSMVSGKGPRIGSGYRPSSSSTIKQSNSSSYDDADSSQPSSRSSITRSSSSKLPLGSNKGPSFGQRSVIVPVKRSSISSTSSQPMIGSTSVSSLVKQFESNGGVKGTTSVYGVLAKEEAASSFAESMKAKVSTKKPPAVAVAPAKVSGQIVTVRTARKDFSTQRSPIPSPLNTDAIGNRLPFK